MRAYDFLFLDAQGTLLETRQPVSAIYADMCDQLGRQVSRAEVNSVIRDLWGEYRDSSRGQTRYDTSDEITREWWTCFNSRVFHRLGMKDGLEQFVQGLWDAFGHPENWRAFPEVMDVLSELKGRGYRLAMVSNWDSRLLPICDHLGITPYMEFILASAVVGVEKPDQRIFQVALEHAGVPPQRAVHVGDDYEADFLGGRDAGIDVLLLDREGRHPPERSPIHSLRELLLILP